MNPKELIGKEIPVDWSDPEFSREIDCDYMEGTLTHDIEGLEKGIVEWCGFPKNGPFEDSKMLPLLKKHSYIKIVSIDYFDNESCVFQAIPIEYDSLLLSGKIPEFIEPIDIEWNKPDSQIEINFLENDK